MLRWINRGAKGIALFDETWQNTKLRYVFDISDTHMVAGGRSPYLWQMQEHQREEILTHLEEVYGLEEKDTATLQDALMAVAREMVNDNVALALTLSLRDAGRPLPRALVCIISRKICSLTIIICMSFSISNEVHSHFM